MLDQPNKNGHSNGHGNGGLVVEDLQNLTFQVHRKVFVSPEILEDENRAIFDKCWVYVGHASEIKNPGDFRTRQVAGRPVIFCRDRKGEVRALFNVCRHRGALVCREREGNARQFQCIYHGWTYNTDGSIKGIPGDDAYPPGFDKQGKGLTPVARLEHYKDFYFANLDRRRGRPAHLSRRRQGLHRSRRRSVAVRPAWRSSPACRNTTSRRTGSCWSRTASTTITSSPRIRPGSTTCATPAST